MITVVVALFGLSFAGTKQQAEATASKLTLVHDTTSLDAFTDLLNMPEDDSVSKFEQAVALIKKYETLNEAKHWPFVGYGHRVLPGERYRRGRVLGEAEADALLRKDLLKNCAVFRDFGADSLLLGVLAYNIGSGATMRSQVVNRLRNGNREIRDRYVAHSRYKGKEHKQIKQRRIEEFELLYDDLDENL